MCSLGASAIDILDVLLENQNWVSSQNSSQIFIYWFAALAGGAVEGRPLVQSRVRVLRAGAHEGLRAVVIQPELPLAAALGVLGPIV